MTNQEFSDQFSTLLNSYGSIGQFGEQASRQEIVLDEFEKSGFLTQAQDIIVKSYIDKTLNQEGQGLDDTARRQTDFSSLFRVAELAQVSSPTVGVFDSRGIVYQLPKRTDGSAEVLVITNEKLLMKRNSGGDVIKEYVIKPISAQEYDRQMSKAFGKPLKRQAWRLFQNKATGFDVMSELIPRDTLQSGCSWVYRIRYVRRPRPIVLENLPDGLQIDGVSTETECELNAILHRDILYKAVELAAASRGLRPVQQTRQEQ